MAAPGAAEAGTKEAIRVVLADDDPVMCENLTKLLSIADDVEVVGVANDVAGAIKLAHNLEPDVVLTDVNMPQGGGVRAAEGVRSTSPRTRVVAHTAYEDRAAVMQMVRAGAIGYVVKGCPAEELLGVVRRAARGEASLSAPITMTVVQELAALLRDQAQQAEATRLRVDSVRRFAAGEGMSMVFQPIVDVRSGLPVGYEALARFDRHPTRSPREWFEEAGAVGYRLELEVAAARMALEVIDQVPLAAFLSINASPATLASDDFARLLEEAPCQRVVVEVSAQAQAVDEGLVVERLRRLRARGLRVAVDDLGHGPASLRHVLITRAELLKVDESLVRAMPGGGAAEAMVRSLVGYAREVGATVIAEGVEQRDEVERLTAVGVALAQGFHFSRPAPAAQVLGSSALAS